MTIHQYNKEVELLKQKPIKEISDLLKSGECPMPVHLLVGVPLGMFHCELCGTMVVAGIPHGPIDPEWNPKISLAAKDFYEAYPELWD